MPEGVSAFVQLPFTGHIFKLQDLQIIFKLLLFDFINKGSKEQE